MKPTAKQKRINLIAAFLVVIIGALVLVFLSGYNKPIPSLKRQLEKQGFSCTMERNVDAGDYSGLSDDVDALKISGERVLIFAYDSFDDAAAQENEFWQTYGEENGAGTYLTDRYLLLYTGANEKLKAALEAATD